MSSRIALPAVTVLLVLLGAGLLALHDYRTLTLGERVGPLEMALAGHSHGSPIENPAGDVSKLNDGPGTEGTDDNLFVRDNSCGNGRAWIIAFNSGSFSYAIEDRDGCQAGGDSLDTGTNHSGHATCRERVNGEFVGCGGYSGHGT